MSETSMVERMAKAMEHTALLTGQKELELGPRRMSIRMALAALKAMRGPLSPRMILLATDGGTRKAQFEDYINAAISEAEQPMKAPSANAK